MSKYLQIKTIAKQVLEDFCQTIEDDESSPLDELDIDILSAALAEALVKGCPTCESK